MERQMRSGVIGSRLAIEFDEVAPTKPNRCHRRIWANSRGPSAHRRNLADAAWRVDLAGGGIPWDVS